MSPKPKHAIVVGGLWGDEGKGKIVNYLAKDYGVIARYGGGQNAGHSIIVGGKIIVLHLVPSGISYPDKMNVVGEGCVCEPRGLLDEIKMLRDNDIEVDWTNLCVSSLANVITPYHILEDIINEVSANIGTTLRGIGPAYKDRPARKGLTMHEFVNLPKEALEAKLESEKMTIFRKMNERKIEPRLINAWIYENGKESRQKMLKPFLKDYWRGIGFDSEKISKNMLKARKQLKLFVRDSLVVLNQANAEGKRILYEGAQGTYLDVTHGTLPYVTSSHTIAGGAHIGAVPYLPIDQRILVFKAFATRVGGGPFPTEMEKGDKYAEEIASDGTEFGATTGRARRIGWYDSVLAKRSAMINGATELAITKLDRLDNLNEIKICVAYKKQDGSMATNIVPLAYELEKCTPIYETLKGWKCSTKGITKYDKLPENAQNYIGAIEKNTGCPVKYIGTGPACKQIIVRE
jgi:adenylosuccinate synthase